MKKTYVSLVSQEAIPNVQYIKEFSQEIKTFLFISTNRMEKDNRAHLIVDACKLPINSFHIEIVDEEDFIAIKEGIENAFKNPIFNDSEGYIVNCTLGTKVMSIALFDYFRAKPNADIFYTPIGKNAYRSIIDNSTNELFKSKISVEEYVTGYGIKIKGLGTPLFNTSQYTENFLSAYLEFRDFEFDVLKHLQLDENQKYRNKGIKDFGAIQGLSKFLTTIQFPSKENGKLSKYEVKYLTGGWFEEWVFYKIKDYFKFEASDIVLGFNSFLEAENDLDVVFMYKNDIHIIECKTAIPDTQLQQSTLYKSGALVEKFGRNAHTYLFTLSNLRDNDGEFKKSIKERSLQQKVTIADRHTLISELETFIKEKILR